MFNKNDVVTFQVKDDWKTGVVIGKAGEAFQIRVGQMIYTVPANKLFARA